MRCRTALRVISMVAVVAVAAVPIGTVAATTERSVTHAAPGTYASDTGVIPQSLACGSRSPIAALAGMYDASQLGAGWVRCDLNWWSVQPTNGTTFDWTRSDNVVNAAAHFGIKVLFTVGFTPPWARPNPLPKGTIDPSHVPPARISDFQNFVKAAIARYSPTGHARVPSVVGTVSSWEIWNEPNIMGGWTPPDPVKYGNFLALVANRIHHYDRKATVISGGLAPAVTGNGNYSPWDFAAKMVPTNGFNNVDGVGIHPYTFPAYPDEKIAFNPLYQAVPHLYYVMASYGMAAKKIWSTEVGWPTSSQSSQSLRPWDGKQVGTEAYQAKELPVLLTTWFKLPFVGPLFLYEEQDGCTDNRSWFCKMGLERVDGSKKPAWSTVHTKLAQAIQP